MTQINETEHVDKEHLLRAARKMQDAILTGFKQTKTNESVGLCRNMYHLFTEIDALPWAAYDHFSKWMVKEYNDHLPFNQDFASYIESCLSRSLYQGEQRKLRLTCIEKYIDYLEAL